jgi:hypothetical protein
MRSTMRGCRINAAILHSEAEMAGEAPFHSYGDEKQRQQLRKAGVRARNLKSSYCGVRRTPRISLSVMRSSSLGKPGGYELA